jgi:hypothetical protein
MQWARCARHFEKRKVFLETILGETAKITRMGSAGELNSGCDSGSDRRRGGAEETRSGLRRRGEQGK